MAEGITTNDSKGPSSSKDKGYGLECAVCLQPCVHPAQLPCGHIFCFLCVKGIANQSKKCAMCRQEIPADFIEQPNLLQPAHCMENIEGFEDGYQWFYEGRNGRVILEDDLLEVPGEWKKRIELKLLIGFFIFKMVALPEILKIYNKFVILSGLPIFLFNFLIQQQIKGWWQYDERTSKELEGCYKSGERTCELLIAGFLYVVDLDAMVQLRRNDPSRRRRIKRDLATVPKKGIAGLRTECDRLLHTDTTNNAAAQRPVSPLGRTERPTPTTPSNTPQSPTSGRESPQDNDLQATVERISALSLNAPEEPHDALRNTDNECSPFFNSNLGGT